MKRLAALLAAFSVTAGLAFPASSNAAPGLKRQQKADAIWMVPTDTAGRFIGYYASVQLDEPNGGTFSFDEASVGKGHCTRKKTRHGTSTSCGFRSTAYGTASENFTMDPLLSSAELKLEHKGETFHVTWTGGDPGTYQAFEGCFTWGEDGEEESGEGRGGGLYRMAMAEAHIYGRHLVSDEKDPFGAMLMSGAMVTECTRLDGLSGLRPGERLRVRF